MKYAVTGVVVVVAVVVGVPFLVVASPFMLIGWLAVKCGFPPAEYPEKKSPAEMY